MRSVFLFPQRANLRLQMLLIFVVSVASAALTSYLVSVRFSGSAPGAQVESVATNALAPAPSAGETNIRNLNDLNETLVSIAEMTKPSVVTVFTEKVVRLPQRGGFPMNPFFNAPGFEDFFRDFFGPGPRGGRPGPDQNPYNEYRRQGLGSGVIVSADGFVLTNNHVIAEADEIRVRTLENKTYLAKVVGRDPKTDIAVIKVEEKGLRPIPRGNSDQLRVGEIVLAVGSPMNPNLAHTVTQGIVSATGRSNVGLADYEDFIQTDAAINPGNSGGALVNLKGELVGINTAIVSQSGGSQGIGFAVPINMARSVMEALIEGGEVIRGWLGVMAQDLTDELVKALNLKSKQGVLIADVEEGGPAAKAGIQSGDVLLTIGGQKINDGVELRNRIAQTPPNTEIEVELVRAGKRMKLNVKLERLPTESAQATVEPEKAQVELSKLLGFRVTALSEQILRQLDLPANTTGVLVREVDPASMAARSGLREGDVITSVNRQAISNTKDFVERTKNLKKGDSLLLQVTRQGTNLFLAFQLS